MFRKAILPALVFALTFSAGAHAQNVGDKVDAGAAYAHRATVLKKEGSSFFLHYDEANIPDGWQPVYMVRAARGAAPAQIKRFSVGEKVDAGAAYAHRATVLKFEGASYFLHYDEPNMPDGWQPVYMVRAAGTEERNAAAATAGPRPGKYLILGYAGTIPQPNGSFILKPGGSYEVFLPGGRSIGSGTYAFDAATTTVKWKSGPFADPGWDGTQKFEVSREGKTHIIRLKARTIGTNSTD